MDYVCEHCGGKFNHRVNLWIHKKSEREKYINGKSGVDYLICRECGLRTESLGNHVRQHEMTSVQYLAKYPDAVLTLPRLIQMRARASVGTHVVPIQDRSGATLCPKCDEWYLQRFAAKHLSDCVSYHPDKYEKGKDYVECPECAKALLRLGEHLRNAHRWDDDRIALEVGRGLKMMADSVAEKWRSKQDFEASQSKREQTHLERHGFSNPFSDPVVQEKIVETNQRRYGVDHPMKNEEVFTRQTESAQRGPSEQEVFFMEHVVLPNVIYSGAGSRFIRTKVGVHKYGRVVKDLNPDFMVLPDNVLKSAQDAIRDGRPLDRQKHRTKYVIELLGDWYHSEQMIGVKPEEHVAEMVAAYKSAGIECLALWEKDVMGRWNEIESMVSAWIEKAVRDINESPVWKKPTRSQVDRRVGAFVCPYGSGRRFKTQEKLTKWMFDPLNFWRPEMVEGRDYVKCLECQNVRVGKVAEHLRQSHSGMTKEDYLAKYPGALMKADRVGNGR